MSIDVDTSESARAAIWSQIGVYLLLTLAISGVFWYCIIHTGRLGAGHGLYATGLMWSPGLAGLATRLLYEGSARNIGWQWGRTRYQLLSYLIPIAYASVVYVIVWVTGLGGFFNAAFVNLWIQGIFDPLATPVVVAFITWRRRGEVS